MRWSRKMESEGGRGRGLGVVLKCLHMNESHLLSWAGWRRERLQSHHTEHHSLTVQKRWPWGTKVFVKWNHKNWRAVRALRHNTKIETLVALFRPGINVCPEKCDHNWTTLSSHVHPTLKCGLNVSPANNHLCLFCVRGCQRSRRPFRCGPGRIEDTPGCIQTSTDLHWPLVIRSLKMNVNSRSEQSQCSTALH